MAGSLDGRKALITGASSGIGEATAVAMVAGGRRRWRSGRGARTASTSSPRGSRRWRRGVAHSRSTSATRRAAALVRGDAAAELGGLDTLVNNAGVMLLGPLQGADTDEWRTMIDVNLLGLLYCTHAALPLMREGGGGHVVNVSSVAGRIGQLRQRRLQHDQVGVVGFSESLRQEAAISTSASG